MNETPSPLPVEPPPLAAMPPPLPVVLPRVWPALLVGIASLPAALIVSTIVVFLLLMDRGDIDLFGDTENFQGVMGSIVATPFGMIAVLVPGQFVMMAASFGPALLSPRSLADRLGFTRSRLKWWSLPTLLGGTLFMGMVGGLLSHSVFGDPGENMKMIQSMARDSDPSTFALLALIISLMPAIMEEALFRGYIQRRLLESWSPVAAIATSSALFIAMHFDLAHMLAITPLALWLGVVAWRAGSIWPVMFCHGVQNLLSIIGARFGDPSEQEAAWTTGTFVWLAITGTLFALALFIMSRTPRPAMPRDATLLAAA